MANEFVAKNGILVKPLSGNTGRIVTTDVNGILQSSSVIVSAGSISAQNVIITSLTPSNSGSMLTWDASGKIVDAGIPSSAKGKIVCNIGQKTYSVSYLPLVYTVAPDPLVTLTVPNQTSDLFIQGVYSKSINGFSVTLSNTPDVTGYEINWLAPSSLPATYMNTFAEDVRQKPITLSSALNPSTSGANLNIYTTSDGMISDSLDFAVGDRSFWNFVMPDSFNAGTSITVDLKTYSDTTGTSNYDIKLGTQKVGNAIGSSSGATIFSDSITYSVASQVYNKGSVLTSSYQNVSPGDIIILGVTRTGGSIVGNMKVVGIRITW